MVKLLVADDEPIAVESVEFMLQKNFPGLFQIKSCSTGKLVVELAAVFHPDVVVVDVDMPGISGIEAIRQIKEQNSTAVFVIISAYDYFDYAQEAVKLGVTEYMLKPFNEEGFTALFKRILALLDNQQTSKQNILEQQEKWLMSIPVLENSFINSLNQLGECDVANVENTCKLLGHRDVGGFVIIFSLCWEDGEKLDKLSYSAFCHDIRRTYKCILGSRKDCIITYVFDEDGGLYTNAEESITKLKQRAAALGEHMLVGVGTRQHTISEAHRSYKEARSAVNMLKEGVVDHINGNILFMERLLKEESPRQKRDVLYIEEKICAGMENEDPVLVVNELDAYINRAKTGEESFASVRNAIADLWLNLGRRLGTPAETARTELNSLLKSEDTDALADAVRDIVVSTAVMLEMRKRKKATSIVERAEKYISEHYAQAISLDDVAQSVNLSQHYFSRFFKQEKGVGFADYLAKVRIDHAIELLLMDELSVKEIAYMVGFNDPNYFSKAFKKITGFTPLEYKSSTEGDN